MLEDLQIDICFISLNFQFQSDRQLRSCNPRVLLSFHFQEHDRSLEVSVLTVYLQVA
jgi:hypothetical protein